MSEMPLKWVCGGWKELAGRGGKEMFGSNFQVGLVGTAQRFKGASPDLAIVLALLSGPSLTTSSSVMASRLGHGKVSLSRATVYENHLSR